MESIRGVEVCGGASWYKLGFVNDPVEPGYFYGIQTWSASNVKVTHCGAKRGLDPYLLVLSPGNFDLLGILRYVLLLWGLVTRQNQA